MGQTNAGLAEVLRTDAPRLDLKPDEYGADSVHVFHTLSGKRLGMVFPLANGSWLWTSALDTPPDCDELCEPCADADAAAEAMAAAIVTVAMERAPRTLRTPCERCDTPTLNKYLWSIEVEGEYDRLLVCPACYKHYEEANDAERRDEPWQELNEELYLATERALDGLDTLADELEDATAERSPVFGLMDRIRSRIVPPLSNDQLQVSSGKRYVFEYVWFPHRRWPRRQVLEDGVRGSVTDDRNVIRYTPGFDRSDPSVYFLERHGSLAASVLYDFFGAEPSDELVALFEAQFRPWLHGDNKLRGSRILTWVIERPDVPWLKVYTESLPRQIIRCLRHR